MDSGYQNIPPTSPRTPSLTEALQALQALFSFIGSQGCKSDQFFWIIVRASANLYETVSSLVGLFLFQSFFSGRRWGRLEVDSSYSNIWNIAIIVLGFIGICLASQ